MPSKSHAAIIRTLVIVQENTQPAINLLGRVDELEATLLHFQFGEPATKLKMIPWQEVGRDVYLPSWRETVNEYRETLLGLPSTGFRPCWNL
jgi:hypothetical protein